MIITYLRSSSYGTHSLCQTQYLFEYVLGYKGWSNIQAEKGTVVHKVLEILANEKLCQQKQELFNNDEEILGKYLLGTKNHQDIFDEVYNHYSNQSRNTWGPADKKDCFKWLNKVLKNKIYAPNLQNIKKVEHHFDIEFKQDWAKYNYTLPDNSEISGNIGIKGTIDLLVEEDSDTIHIIDYKTGKRKDWATNTEKDYNSLQKDPQLNLYFYAINHDFPNYKYYIVSIYYINYGGIFSFPFDNSNLEFAEKLIKNKTEIIRNSNTVSRIYPSYFCENYCRFGQESEPWTNSGKTMCEFIYNKTKKDGVDKVFQIYNNGTDHISKYGAGGGRENRV